MPRFAAKFTSQLNSMSKKSSTKFKGKVSGSGWSREVAIANLRRVFAAPNLTDENFPVPRKLFLICGIRAHISLEQLLRGGVRDDSISNLAEISNVAIAFAELGLGAQFLGLLEGAQTILANLASSRPHDSELYFCAPNTWASISIMVEIHLLQIESPDCTIGLLNSAIQVVKSRILEGSILQIASHSCSLPLPLPDSPGRATPLLEMAH